MWLLAPSLNGNVHAEAGRVLPTQLGSRRSTRVCPVGEKRKQVRVPLPRRAYAVLYAEQKSWLARSDEASVTRVRGDTRGRSWLVSMRRPIAIVPHSHGGVFAGPGNLKKRGRQKRIFTQASM